MRNRDDEKFNPKETQRRFEAALRGARIAGHKSKEDVSRHIGKVESKPARAKKKR